jgi:nitroreductase
MPLFFGGIMGTELIRSRRSIRKYSPLAVAEDVIDDILDCGRLAPTAMNLQPWLLGATTDKELLKRLAQLADHGKFIAECSVCFSVFTERGAKYRLEDGAAATMNIIHSAWAHGLGTCWIAGDKKGYADDVRKLLNVPESHSLIALVPAGHPAEEPAKIHKKPLGR